jgi:hypothetical protein
MVRSADERTRERDSVTGHDKIAIQAYRRLVSAVDAFVQKVLDRYGSHIQCRPGCAACCERSFSVFPVEAWVIQQGARDLPTTMHEALRLRSSFFPKGVCPALEGDQCMVHPFRPLICRTHGFPLLVAGSLGEREVCFCPRNFRPGAAGSVTLSGDAVLDLEALNEALAKVHIQFMKEWNSKGGVVLPDRVGLLHFVRRTRKDPCI